MQVTNFLFSTDTMKRGETIPSEASLRLSGNCFVAMIPQSEWNTGRSCRPKSRCDRSSSTIVSSCHSPGISWFYPCLKNGQGAQSEVFLSIQDFKITVVIIGNLPMALLMWHNIILVTIASCCYCNFKMIIFVTGVIFNSA